MTQPAIPGPDEVNKFHSRSDKDSSTFAQHHSLGVEANQASPGDHIHDGRSSKLIGKGLNPTFPTVASNPPTQAEVNACIQALRDLGFGTS